MEVNPGYKQTEVGVIPEDWEVKTLGEIGEALIGLTYKPTDVRQHGTLVLRSSNIQNDALAFDDNVFVDTAIPERIMVLNDDVLICVRNGSRDLIGKSALLDDRTKGMTFGAFMAVYRSQNGKLASYLFQSAIIKRQINEHLGATINQITNKSINAFRIPVPPLPEQRAIAEALSDVDGLLSGLDRLIAKKRDLKQAAMQQLLTGQTRLPSFQGEWEDTTLGDLATFLSGGTPSRSNDDYWTGDIPWISASSLRCFEIWRSHSNVTKEAVAAGSKMAPVGSSLLLVRGSALHNEILCGLVTKPVCFNQDVKALVPRSQVVPRFLTLFIRGTAEKFLKLVSSAGNTAGVLDTKLLRAFPIKLPPIPEQTAIATILSDMDAELAALEARRDKTRALKQGMMQELLTGKTRLL
jgi:type I restriction enzyme S subunit